MTTPAPFTPARYTSRSCRVCGGSLGTVLNLGLLALSAFQEPGAEAPPAAPLDFTRCTTCGLVQLRHTVDPDQLYRDYGYWYRSGVNETMRDELADVVAHALDWVAELKFGDLVIDVGANDGTLLRNYGTSAKAHDIARVAFEPAASCHAALLPACEVLIPDYFPAGLGQLDGAWGRVKVLTSIACFYDLDDPIGFVEHVSELLHPQGIWVLQFQDLDQMLRTNAFDNICAEHVFYPSLAAIERMVRGCGLEVVDATARRINGGSYRLTIAQQGAYRVTDRVGALRHREAVCERADTLLRFAERVLLVRAQIRATLASVIDRGQVVDLYAASTKANTLLQYCGIDARLIRQAWERSPEKIGRLTATGIPIVSEEAGRSDPPAALFLGAWQFKDAFVKREASYLRRGGSLIVPLPQCEIVLGSGELKESGYGHGV